MIISIRRGDGNTRPTVRHLHSLSRFSETPDKLVIDLLENGEYCSLGTETKVAEQDSARSLWAVMPANEGDAQNRKELLESAKCGVTYGKKIIKDWNDSGHLGKVGKGVANDPERFWKLDISRSEPPGVVTNQVNEDSDRKAGGWGKSRLVTLRDEVMTNQVPVVTQAGANNVLAATEDMAAAHQSRLVTTPVPISDQPCQDDGESF